MQHNKLLIVDSMALLFRGYFATAATGQLMQNRLGQYTNGIYQFTKYLLNAIEFVSPSHVVCAMDMGKETFRNEIYPEYKANRGEPPQELVPQFDLIKDLIAAFDIPILGVHGYEADDIMGTVAKQARDNDHHVFLLTGDGDSLQLIDESIDVVMMKKGFGNYEVITKHTLPEVKGVQSPEQIIELKALMGDPSDNIPGCPGVGPKTALKLLDEFGSLDAIFANIDALKGKVKERLMEHKDLVYLSRDLATIRTDAPVQYDQNEAFLQFDTDKIHSTFEHFEFRSLKAWIK